MRGISFKAKRLDNKKWIHGSLIIFDENYMFIMPPYEGASSLTYAELFALTALMVDPLTVCQYTGLEDKNGVKIFEGDIVDMSDEWWDSSGPAGHQSPVTSVIWDEATSGFFPFANYDCDCGVFINASGCVVVGNIHDKEN